MTHSACCLEFPIGKGKSDKTIKVFSLNRGDKISDFRETKATKSYEVTHRKEGVAEI